VLAPRSRRALTNARAHRQAKLDALCALADAGRVRDFCAAFVPLDLSAEDAAEFAAGLEADPERRVPCPYLNRLSSLKLTHTMTHHSGGR